MKIGQTFPNIKLQLLDKYNNLVALDGQVSIQSECKIEPSSFEMKKGIIRGMSKE